MSAETVTASPQDDPFEFGQQAVWAIFTGEPDEQMVYSFLGGIVAWVATALSAGATAFLIIIFTITFFIGLTRYIIRWLLSLRG